MSDPAKHNVARLHLFHFQPERVDMLSVCFGKIGSPVKILRNMFCKNLPLHRLPLDGDVGQGWLCILMMSPHVSAVSPPNVQQVDADRNEDDGVRLNLQLLLHLLFMLMMSCNLCHLLMLNSLQQLR